MSSELRPRGPAPSNVDLALEAVREAIVGGRLRPGERIKEIPLAEELGFSRAPVRDAFRLLERDGLVELVPNRGAVVPELRAVISYGVLRYGCRWYGGVMPSMWPR